MPRGRSFAAAFALAAIAATGSLARQAGPPGEQIGAYPITAEALTPHYKVAEVTEGGQVSLSPLQDGPAIGPALAGGPVEGDYLLVPVPLSRGSITPIVRVRVEEVLEGGSLAARVEAPARAALPVGADVGLIRPTGLATGVLRKLPPLIPIRGESAHGTPGPVSSLLESRTLVRLRASTINLNQIGLALQQFHDSMGALPPAVVFGPDGKPWHSWRVLILPFMEFDKQYKAYRFDQPWDSPANKALIENMPSVYRDPLVSESPPGVTNYAALVGPGTAFPPEGRRMTAAGPPIDAGPPIEPRDAFSGLELRDVTDRTSSSIAIAPVSPARAIPWTKPEDIHVGPNFPALGAESGIAAPASLRGRNLAPILFLDGSARTVSTEIAREVFEGLLTIRGGEVIDPDVITGLGDDRGSSAPTDAIPALRFFRLDGKVMAEFTSIRPTPPR